LSIAPSCLFLSLFFCLSLSSSLSPSWPHEANSLCHLVLKPWYSALPHVQSNASNLDWNLWNKSFFFFNVSLRYLSQWGKVWLTKLLNCSLGGCLETIIIFTYNNLVQINTNLISVCAKFLFFWSSIFSQLLYAVIVK
jgi:hypothetical protein